MSSSEILCLLDSASELDACLKRLKPTINVLFAIEWADFTLSISQAGLLISSRPCSSVLRALTKCENVICCYPYVKPGLLGDCESIRLQHLFGFKPFDGQGLGDLISYMVDCCKFASRFLNGEVSLAYSPWIISHGEMLVKAAIQKANMHEFSTEVKSDLGLDTPSAPIIHAGQKSGFWLPEPFTLMVLFDESTIRVVTKATSECQAIDWINTEKLTSIPPLPWVTEAFKSSLKGNIAPAVQLSSWHNSNLLNFEITDKRESDTVFVVEGCTNTIPTVVVRCSGASKKKCNNVVCATLIYVIMNSPTWKSLKSSNS